MWDELVRDLARFPDGVLTGLDGTGQLFGLRWAPRPVPAEQALRGRRATGVELVDGPASLLCHSHDEQLWRLRSFLVRGTLRTDGDDWVLTPRALVVGGGVRGPLGDARAFLDARRRAGRYLGRRGLARPRVPWDRLRELG